MNDYQLRVKEQHEVAPRIYEIVLKGEFDYHGALPGRFVDVQVPDQAFQLRRPFAISDADKKNQELTLIYRVNGAGTDLLSKVKKGSILKVLGCLGKGFPYQDMSAGDRALLVAGGTGIPPILFLSKFLHQKGVQSDIAVGFQNKETMFATQELALNGNLEVATNDGSYGVKGFVSFIIDQEWKDRKYNKIFVCGPKGMLISIQNRFPDHPEMYFSLESRMACGLGACEGCVVADQDGNLSKRVCADGPVFNSREVNLNV